MPELVSFDYAIVRVTPRVERGEFLNVGVVLCCATKRFLEARIELDHARLSALAPNIDCGLIEEYLSVIPRVCGGGASAGPIGALPQRARFHWIVAPRSTVIQMSPVHTGLCCDLQATLDELFEKMVLVGAPAKSGGE